MDILKFAIPEIIFGRGSLNHAGQCALRLGARKVFLVSDVGIEKTGWLDHLTGILKKDGIKWVYYSNVSSNPRDFQVEQGAQLYLEENADVVIAIGGGSPMDTAKGIAILANNGGKIKDYEGANKVQRPLPPMVLITTTAGSGSDISQFCIITDTTRAIKMSIITRTLVPNISIVDPLILQTKSRTQIVLSAVDALAHAVEAYVSIIASPFTRMHSLKAIELIYQNLKKAVETRDIDALEQLSIASVSASIAFSNASLGAEHALAHSLGGYSDLSHGRVHPILLTAVMRFNLDHCVDKMADIGRILSGNQKGTDRKIALNGIDILDEFFSTLNVSLRLRDEVGKKGEAFLEPIAKMAIKDVCCLTNPKPLTANDMLSILEEVW